MGVSILLAATSGCAGLYFRDGEVVSSHYDAAEQATRVNVRFSVVDEDDRPVNDLEYQNFAIWEDHVLATSESYSVTSGEIPPVGITVLLDSSKSMYDAGPEGSQSNAVVEIKRMARDFVTSLHGQGPFQFSFYRFAADLVEIPTVDAVLDNYSAGRSGGGDRWTALYYAVHEAIERHPDNVIVIFSDGADNYSQNRGGVDLERVTQRINEHGTPVFAIGSGNSENEYDRSGISGAKALRRVCHNGSMRLATDPDALEELLDDIHDQVRVRYTISYFSPNLGGEHRLRIRVRAHDRKGASPWFSFQAQGARR